MGTGLERTTDSGRPVENEALTLKSGMSDGAIVHVIDDDKALREGLSSLLRSVDLATLTYSSVDVFLGAQHPDTPGCLVLDVRLPGTSGLDLQARLTSLGIFLPVILMTAHGDVPMSVHAMKAGAVDFLTKPFRDQQMLDAVAVAIERDRAGRKLRADEMSLRQRLATLSSREQQVMRLVVAGKRNKQVARDLGLSEITVKIHRSAAMRKMSARSFADLVRMSEVLQRGAR